MVSTQLYRSRCHYVNILDIYLSKAQQYEPVIMFGRTNKLRCFVKVDLMRQPQQSFFIVILLVIALSAISFGSQAAALPSENAGTNMHDAERIDEWLILYKRAWEQQDADLVAGLFSESARYAVNPLEDVLHGRQAIKQYWAGGGNSQKDIQFEYEVWAITKDMTIVHWTAAFTRTATRERIKMDGVFRLVFSDAEEGFVCVNLEEWWFLKAEIP